MNRNSTVLSIVLLSGVGLFSSYSGFLSHEAVASELKPQYGDWGVDLAGMDKSVQPGDDFYSYVNGAWHEQAVIPADKKATGPITELRQKASDQIMKIVDEIVADSDVKAGSERQKIRDWYLSLLDEDKLRSLGLSPLRGDFDDIDAISDRRELHHAGEKPRWTWC